MNLTIDYIVIFIYLAGVTVFGIISGGKQATVHDYFLGGRKMSWWSVGFSIVASETSTLTFISIPGLAYKSNLHFLQVAFGYFLGRIVVSLVFIPAYFRGDMETAYDFLGKRFGLPLRKFASTVFIVTRVLASGVRLFATAIPVHIITGWDYPVCILVIGGFTLIYTYTGGLRAVVAMDVVQLFIYLLGAGISMYIILSHLPGGWGDVVSMAGAGGEINSSSSIPAAGPGSWDSWHPPTPSWAGSWAAPFSAWLPTALTSSWCRGSWGAGQSVTARRRSSWTPPLSFSSSFFSSSWGSAYSPSTMGPLFQSWASGPSMRYFPASSWTTSRRGCRASS